MGLDAKFKIVGDFGCKKFRVDFLNFHWNFGFSEDSDEGIGAEEDKDKATDDVTNKKDI